MQARLLFNIILALAAIIYIYSKLRKNKLSEAKSLIWISGSIVILLLGLFPSLLDNAAHLLGIAYGPSILFLLSILFLIYVILRQEQDISVLNDKVKVLAQRVALLDSENKRVRKAGRIRKK